MNVSMTTFWRLVLSAAFAVLVGMCAYFLLTQHYALQGLERSIHMAEAASSRLTYGIVKSVDLERRTITMTYTEQIAYKKVDVLILLNDRAYIARQELAPVGAALYTSLSAPVEGRLSDLTPGTRIAVDVDIKTSEGLRSSLVLYGNPL